MEPIESQDPQTYAIIGAAMEVHRQLGSGFLEHVYHEAMEIEFTLRNIPFLHEPKLTIHYKGRPLRKEYSPDFICFEDIIVELKAQSSPITNGDRAQTLNYLKTTGFRRALILNFGTPSLAFDRIVLGYEKPIK